MTTLETAAEFPEVRPLDGGTLPELVLPTTPYLYPNEPVAFVGERVLSPADHRAPHRYRLYGVVRGDQQATHVEDMGLASQWPGAQEFLVFCEYAHTAQEARELCEDMRQDVGADLRAFLEEKQAESSLIYDWLNWREEKRAGIRNASTFGPYVTRQRNAFRESAVVDREHKRDVV